MTATTEAKKPCAFKHTKFQADGDLWKCPQCGASDGFYIDDSPNFECELVHEKDNVCCENCERGWSGKAVMNAIAKKLDQVECPTCTHCETCKGKRMVSKSQLGQQPT